MTAELTAGNGVRRVRLGVGDIVRTSRPLRQDGTFPDPAIRVGEVLVAQDSIGQIVDIGIYLQQHVIYAVAFDDGRVVGCLERELVPQPVAQASPGGEA